MQHQFQPAAISRCSPGSTPKIMSVQKGDVAATIADISCARWRGSPIVGSGSSKDRAAGDDPQPGGPRRQRSALLGDIAIIHAATIFTAAAAPAGGRYTGVWARRGRAKG